MFGRSKRPSSDAPPPAASRSIRDTLFGDTPLAEWPSASAAPSAGQHEPWRSFIEAREAVAAGNIDRAVSLWRAIAAMPDLESRHHAQAWHFLRAHGVQPPPELAKRLLAVVFEVSVNGGLDLLAAYPERTARFYSHAGVGGIIWDRPSDALDAPINAVLSAAQLVLDAIGPATGPRPPAPLIDQARVNLISPAGLHYGQGSINVIMNEPFAKPLFDAGIRLMQELTERDLRSRRAVGGG